MPDVLRARIVRAVGEPQRQVAAAQTLSDFDAVQNMLQSLFPNLAIGIAERSVLVDLVLKHVRVDGAGAQSMLRRECLNAANTAGSFRQIPQHVQRNRGANAGPSMHLARIAEFLFQRAGGRRL